MSALSHFIHSGPVAFLGPFAALVPLLLAGIDAPLLYWPFLIYGIILLFMVEWGIARRLGDHRTFVNDVLAKAKLQADSLDLQHATDVKRFERIERTVNAMRDVTTQHTDDILALQRKVGIRP